MNGYVRNTLLCVYSTWHRMTRAMPLIITPVAPAIARQGESNDNLRWLPFLDQ